MPCYMYHIALCSWISHHNIYNNIYITALYILLYTFAGRRRRRGPSAQAASCDSRRQRSAHLLVFFAVFQQPQAVAIINPSPHRRCCTRTSLREYFLYFAAALKHRNISASSCTISHHAASPQRHAAVVNVIAVILPLRIARFTPRKFNSLAAAQQQHCKEELASQLLLPVFSVTPPSPTSSPSSCR
jgi:hypothetical protein